MPDTIPSAIHILTHLMPSSRCQYDPYFTNDELKYIDSSGYLAQNHTDSE